MKTSRFTDSQIIAILKQAEGGSPVPELCREHGISNATFYKWRSKFGGMDASLMARMKELEDENRRLKKMYAEERLKAEIVAEALAHSIMPFEATGFFDKYPKDFIASHYKFMVAEVLWRLAPMK